MLTEKAIKGLKDLVGVNQLITDPAELIVYEMDAAQDHGIPDGVVFPRSTEQVQQIARWACDNKVALIGRGAGTGLSGGAVAEQGGLIVEFSRLNHILEIDPAGRSALVEPGVINLVLDETVKTFGLYYPPDPASGRAATLGGNVAENAGGPHCFKYGVTTNYVTGLACILADGRQLHAGGRAFDYPEYDFVRLLTGSEGTLGLVTDISVRLLHNPPGVKTMMAAFDSVEQAGTAVSAVISAGLVPATMEMMDQRIARIIEEYTHAGLLTEAGALLIIEVDGYPASLDPQMEEVAGILQENGGYSLHVANSSEERDKIWYGRKSAAGAMARLAPAYLLLDGTVPRSKLAKTLEASNRICEESGLKVGYVLHAGDGNLHPFILMYPGDKDQVERVHRAGEAFMREVVRLGGSITGEHGVGIEKRPYMPIMFNPVELGAMLQVKQVFDPSNLMNPGKIFPDMPFEDTLQNVEAALPPLDFAPAALDEAQNCVSAISRSLAGLSRAGQPVLITEPVLITGSASHTPRTAGQLATLSTSNLKGVREFAPQDLYVTAGAGSTLDELQAYLEREGKWIPMASPWPAATLGGLLAANVNAPLRMRYGSLSDQVLAMTVVLGDGRILRAGRPVVKNVAGYDLAKLFVGSFGTLGLIADITCKVTALPRSRRSLLVPLENLDQGLTLGQRCLNLALVASAVVLTKGLSLPETAAPIQPGAPYWLTYTAEGMPQDVDVEIDLVLQALRKAGAPEPVTTQAISGTLLWQALLGEETPQIKIRAGVPAKDLPAFVGSQRLALERGNYLVDFASGLTYAAANLGDLDQARAWTDALRQAALRLGGYSLVLEMPDAWQGKLDCLGYHADTLELMRALKARWDPAGILNPGAILFELGSSKVKLAAGRK